ncbi:trehalose-phosphatase [Corynebacterium lubricantis]|uniref:trehalose-phosphatase n=1 Tax=Corynebacterium lubricantis TaxID=541095 RepID=UPI00037BAEA9|nr:trehalose-phosphatase [Corynebacterium lubricantis]
MTPAAHHAIAHLAQAERLLLATDFDGTVAPLRPDPMSVIANPTTVRALESLATLPNTEVVVLSGRHLDGLMQVCPLREPVVLVGSHGAEQTDGGLVLSDDDEAYLDSIEATLMGLIADYPLAYIEVKPYQRVVHVAHLAEVDPEAALGILDAARQIETGGRPTTDGSNIVEFSAVEFTKGMWVERRKRDFTATLFAGDDVTDESVFPYLSHGDVGIKVGEGATGASLRLDTIDEMAAFYDSLSAARGAATV